MTKILDFPAPEPDDVEKMCMWIKSVGDALKLVSDDLDNLHTRLTRIEKKLSAGEDE